MSAGAATGDRSARPMPLAAVARYLLVAAIGLLLALPGIWTMPPLDRDEARFVQATRQMVETGDYVDIRFQDEARYKKPIGIYWLQAAAVALSGKGEAAPIWVYRLVSVLGVMLAVMATYWSASRLFSRQAGLVAALVLAGIFGTAFEARVAKTDAMLLACAVFAQGALAQLHLAARTGASAGRGLPWIFWIAQGTGILIKGPVTPLLSALTIVVLSLWERDWRWLRGLRPVPGLALVLAIVLPWLIWITWASGGAFWQESVGRDLLGKVAAGQESHGAPPGYYVLTYGLFFWPFGLLAIAAGLLAMNAAAGDPRLRFCLSWYIPFWLVLELVPTKLPHYMLPAYPALALMAGWALTLPRDAFLAPLRRWQVWLWYAAAAGLVLATLVVAAVLVGAPLYLEHRFSGWGALAAAAALLAPLFAFVRGGRPSVSRIALAAGSAGLVYALAFTLVLPSLGSAWLSPRIAAAFAGNRPCNDSVLAAVRFHEPSLVFLAGTRTRLTDVEGAARLLLEQPGCAMALVPDDEEGLLASRLAEGGRTATPVADISGVNYSSGRRLSLRLYRVVEP